MINILFIIFCFSLGFLLFYKFPVLEYKPLKATSLKVSLIIPARNEEANLPILLDSIAKQSYAPYEVICVDDESTDETKKVIGQFDATYIKVEDKPLDWTGKTWACQVGALHSKGDILIFIDADVKLEKNAIESLFAAYLKNGNVVSVEPYHTVDKLYEHFAMFFNAIGIAGNGVACPFSKNKAGLFGPFILMSKAQFDSINGYTQVKRSVIEDVDLGNIFEQSSIGYDLYTGKKLISFKMYNNLKDLLVGFTKNYSSGATKTPIPLLILTFLWVMAVTAVPIMVIKSAILLNYNQLALGIGLYGAIVIQLIFILKHIGSFKKRYTILYFVFLLVFHAVFIYSIICKLFIKKVKWKGRDISLK